MGSDMPESELVKRMVIPMVRERSREPGDGWDRAAQFLDSVVRERADASSMQVRDGGVFAVVSTDRAHPFLLGFYDRLDRAEKAQGGKPDKWWIFTLMEGQAPPALAALDGEGGGMAEISDDDLARLRRAARETSGERWRRFHDRAQVAEGRLNSVRFWVECLCNAEASGSNMRYVTAIARYARAELDKAKPRTRRAPTGARE